MVLFLAGGIVYAQGHRNRDWNGYPDMGGSSDLRQTALNAGYNEGSKEGRKDRDKRRYSDFRDFDSYKKADKDYSSRLGDRELYQRYFRMAFESGYDTENPRPGGRDNNRRGNYDGNNRRGRNWDRYGAYGGSYELRQTALNAGYNEGNKQGRNDAKRGRQRNFREFSSYQKATDDYSSKLGDKELYRRYYREGFENGYEDGFNGY
jgi:hypothetical protein